MRWHDVPRSLTTAAERAAAAELGHDRSPDGGRVADPDRFGFAQTLAGAHELLEHYRTAPEPWPRLLLEAAADARRLGHASALSAPLLRALAVALWRDEQGRPDRPGRTGSPRRWPRPPARCALMTVSAP